MRVPRFTLAARGSVQLEYILLAGLVALGVLLGLSRLSSSKESGFERLACELLGMVAGRPAAGCGGSSSTTAALAHRPLSPATPPPGTNPGIVRVGEIVQSQAPDGAGGANLLDGVDLSAVIGEEGVKLAKGLRSTSFTGESFQVADSSGFQPFTIEPPRPAPAYGEQLRRALQAACEWPGASCPAGELNKLTDEEVVALLRSNTHSVVLSPDRYHAAFEHFDSSRAAWHAAVDFAAFRAGQRGETVWRVEDVAAEFSANLRRASEAPDGYLESLAATVEFASDPASLVEALVEHGLTLDHDLVRITGTVPVPGVLFSETGQQVFDQRLDPALKAPMAYQFEFTGSSAAGFSHREGSSGVFVNEFLQADPDYQRSVLANELGHYFFKRLYPGCDSLACRQIDEAGSDAMSLLLLPGRTFAEMVAPATDKGTPAFQKRFKPYDASLRRILSGYWAQTGDWDFLDRSMERVETLRNNRSGTLAPAPPTNPSFGSTVELSRREYFEQLLERIREGQTLFIDESRDRLSGGHAALVPHFLRSQHKMYERLDAGQIPYLERRGNIAWRLPPAR